MRYVKKVNGVMVEAPVQPKRSPETYAGLGYISYSGRLSLRYLDIVDGKTIELPVPPLPEPEIRYSKYELVKNLGSGWPAIKEKIVSAGLWDLWESANELSSYDSYFSSFLSGLTDEEKSILPNCEIK